MATAMKQAGYREQLRQQLADLPAMREKQKRMASEVEELRRGVTLGEVMPAKVRIAEHEYRAHAAHVSDIGLRYETELLMGCPDAALVVKRRRLRTERGQLAKEIHALGVTIAEERERAAQIRAEMESEGGQKIKKEDPKGYKEFVADVESAETLAADVESTLNRRVARLAEIDRELAAVEQAMIAA